jgi:hypothetical protein
MGEVEIRQDDHRLIIHSLFIFYGDAATEELSQQIAADVSAHWNESHSSVLINKQKLHVHFDIKAKCDRYLTQLTVLENTDPRINYFRIEEYVHGNISFVDAINCNTGYFKLENLLNNSTTAAHEFGHTIGLEHPDHLDIRGKGVPGIMYPRGTLTDPKFQYYPNVAAGQTGGTLNPFTRKVLQNDIENLHLKKLNFSKEGLAILGDFTSIWHEKHLP